MWEQLEVDRESAALKNAPSNLSETSTVSAHAAHFPAAHPLLLGVAAPPPTPPPPRP